MDYKQLTIDKIHDGLRERRFSAKELAEEALRVSRAENDTYGAFLHFAPERALAAAEKVDADLAAGKPLGPLAGVPVAVKDVITTKGLRTTCASRILENYVAHYDATAVARLEQAGGVIFGKTNCDEFAMGSSNENSGYYPVHNPAAPDRVPGGSSGGSAAAVAGGFAPVSLGTDTGGSIRQPASFCGVVGVKPTYGRVSRYGLTAFASSLDCIGPFSRTVKDSATLLKVIAGRDPADSTSGGVDVPDYAAALDGNVKGLRLGVPKEYFGSGLDAEVAARIDHGLDVLKKLGCKVSEVSLPHTDYAIASYYLICTAEASANLARYDGVRYTKRAENADTLGEMYRKTRAEGFGREVTRRIILGTYVLSSGYYDAYYLKAQKVRSLIASDFKKAFEKVDALITPVSPFPAFKIGEKTADPLDMYLSDIYTITASLAGITGISVPCGASSEGLPIGMQILADHFAEPRMLKLADAFEKAGGFDEPPVQTVSPRWTKGPVELEQPIQHEGSRSMSTSTPSSQLMRSTVEAMFEYLDRLEQAISDRADAAPERSNFGLPSYRFADEPPEPDSFSCGATVKFVFLGQEASKERMRTVDLTPNKIPAATKNDPEACRRKGLCFPNLVRQQFRVCGQDLVLTRNKAPYGRNHGVVRSADHEPQSLCFEPFRLNIAMSVARALGSETGTSDYEIWVAGEGFNTQWHFHLQFRKQRGPIWEHVDKQAPNSTGSWLLEDYPSQPQCFQDDNRSRLVETLYHEISPFLPINKCETELVSTPHRPAIGLLLSYEQARWKAILVKSWYQSGKLLFGKQPGLHEHLGEVILESLDEVQRVKDDPSAATQELEAQLKNWSTESAT